LEICQIISIYIDIVNDIGDVLRTNKAGSTEMTMKGLGFIASTTTQEGLLKAIQWKIWKCLK
jgi:hypothetical protein